MREPKPPRRGKPLLEATDALKFDRRRTRRLPDPGPAMAGFFSEAEGITLVRVDLIDSSRGGLGLRSPVAADPGTRFELYRDARMLTADRGTVARCAADGEQFRIGVTFDRRARAA